MSDATKETPRDEAAAGEDLLGTAGTGAPHSTDRLAQLQEMIDEVAHVAAPVLREIAAKAAELAAIAAEHAGPLAQKAAEKTQVVGEKVAIRSKEVAADLRRAEAANREAAATESGTNEPPSA